MRVNEGTEWRLRMGLWHGVLVWEELFERFLSKIGISSL
jgi:hypothetical protein